MRHVIFLAALATASVGCGGGSNGNNDGGDLSVAGPRDMARIKADMSGIDMYEASGCVKGVLHDEAGKPIAMESVLACSEFVCLYDMMTDPDGSFEICGLHFDPLAIKTEEKCEAMPRLGAAMAQAHLTHDGETINMGELVVPNQTAGVPLPSKTAMPQTLMVGDGLALTLIGNDFQNALGAEKCKMAAHLVPPAKHFNFKIPDGGTALAAYVVSPFTATSKSKIGVKAPVTAAPNSEVHFWSVAFSNGLLSAQPAIGHADAQGMTASTDPGQGITELTWLIISAKP